MDILAIEKRLLAEAYIIAAMNGISVESVEQYEMAYAIVRLRAELAAARSELAVSVGHLSRLAAAYGCEDFNAALMAAIAAKEE